MTLTQEILKAYTNPVAVFSINQISKRIGKSYPYVNKSVHALIDQGILKKKQTGRSHLCSIDLENKRAVIHLALNELEKHKQVPDNTLQQAKDIDTNRHQQPHKAIIYDPTTKQLLIIASELTTHENTQTLTTQELKQRLLTDKEFYEKRIIISGHEHFFSLLADPKIQRRYHPLL